MTDWSGKQVLIIGVARQGTALARYLAGKGARVVLTDRRPAEDLSSEIESLASLGESIVWALGSHPLDLLEGTSLVCPSGGVPLTLPLIAAAVQSGIPLSNDSQIFLEAAPCQVVGITGSAGKTTTTTLVGQMAIEALNRADGKMQVARGNGSIAGASQLPVANRYSKVWVGGNIGAPLIAHVDEMGQNDLAVMELSSFQLEIMTRSPQVAAVLNITPNHLDRHGTMEAYTAAKAHLLSHQASTDVAVLGRDDPGAWALRNQVAGRLFTFGLGELPEDQEGTYRKDKSLFLRLKGIGDQEKGASTSSLLSEDPASSPSDLFLMPVESIRLRGEHNLCNVLAACAIAAAAGLPVAAMRQAVEGFTGVAHRLEFVRRWHGADWYNDSIATAPERAIAAMRAFDEPLVLLVGGRDKDLPWEDFARLAHQREVRLVVFGEAASKIIAACENAASESGSGKGIASITRCTNLKEAVLAAARLVQLGEVVLLSPGGTSYDEFKDFEERGVCFAQWVRELPVEEVGSK